MLGTEHSSKISYRQWNTMFELLWVVSVWQIPILLSEPYTQRNDWVRRKENSILLRRKHSNSSTLEKWWWWLELCKADNFIGKIIRFHIKSSIRSAVFFFLHPSNTVHSGEEYIQVKKKGMENKASNKIMCWKYLKYF